MVGKSTMGTQFLNWHFRFKKSEKAFGEVIFKL